MIRGFWQSKLAACAVFLLSVGISVLIWIRDRGYPVYIPILATILMLAIGLLSGRLLGNILASSQNTKRLGLLHMDLDPQAFLRSYEAVPGRLKAGTRDYAVTRSYLADGYAAAGDFDKAIETLCPAGSGKKGPDPAVHVLYCNNLCAYTLSKGDMAQARQAIANLEEAVESCRAAKPALARNMEQSLTLYRCRLACLEGSPVDTEWLTDQLPKAPYTLRRLELLQTLAQWALREGRKADAQRYLKQLSQEAGKTFYGPWASRALSRLALEK